ncbi:MAG: thioesterase family protein [Deltaproteobacteria bacterium]|nr:thioesterase family protein [Deltaproteobacteria bacterium]
MSDAIQPGLRGEIGLVVAEEHTAQHLGSGAVRVLATPQMVLLMEQASVAAVDHLLPDGYCTVGAHLDVRHLAPTPEGFEVRAIAELSEIDGRRLTFRVQVFEAPFGEDQLVGEGIHRRAIVSLQRFGDSVAQKAAEAL